jgi:purine-nucleoside phosphorylase
VKTEPLALPSPGDLQAEEAVALIRERTDVTPELAVILGSGLHQAADVFDVEAEISFEGIPGFTAPSVPGHPGRLCLGAVAGVPVAAFLGRIHFYEASSITECALPVRVARQLGATSLVITASAGALDPSLSRGDVVIAVDHINLMGENPLRGWRLPDGTPAFVDLNHVYDPALREIALEEARSLGMRATPGVYLAVSGPSYETPAEVEFMRRAGGTVVGMSVVPEAVPARALGMNVLGLVTVTNVVGEKVLHDDVVRTGGEMAAMLGKLIERVAASASPRRSHGEE